MKILEGNLHKRERRDHEPIKDHLSETLVKLENDSRKLRMNNPEMMASG